MSWIPLVTIAALIWALTNIVDKTMLEKYIKSPYVPFIISVLVSVIAGSTILIVMQSKIPFINAITIIIAGVFYSLGTFLYFKSIQKDDVSSIVPFFQLTPLILLLFGAFFLEEVLLGVQYVGIFLLVGGAILISLKNVQRFRWSKAAPLMVLSSLMYATAYTIMKYNLDLSTRILLYLLTLSMISLFVLFLRYNRVN